MDDNQFTPQEPQQATPQPAPEAAPQQTYQQPAYQQPAYQQPAPQPQQPAYQPPVYQAPPAAPAADKNKMVAGLLGIFLGALGIHKFYLGYTKAAVIMLVVSLAGSLLFGLGPVVMGIIGLIEGIIYLTKNDQDFFNTYVANQKQWF